MDTLTDTTVELRVPSRPEYISVIRAMVTDLALRVAMSPSAVEDVQVAISEACSNVVCHAYAGVATTDESITVRCTANGGGLILEVADGGHGLAAGSRRPADPERCGGFGLVLIRNLMDQVWLESSPGRGTVVRMMKLSSHR